MNTMTTTTPAPRFGSEYLPDRFAANQDDSQLASKRTAHLVRRGSSPTRVTLEQAVPELAELRGLLEENLAALRAIYEEQRRAISLYMQDADAPVAELRALMQPSAPWVAALDETRQLIRSSFLDVAAVHLRGRR
jgi:hypothetical protein